MELPTDAEGAKGMLCMLTKPRQVLESALTCVPTRSRFGKAATLCPKSPLLFIVLLPVRPLALVPVRS